MFLAPSIGFKPSICQHPNANYTFAAMGADIPHGTVRYDLNNGTATYTTPIAVKNPLIIQLLPGKNDTAESWFKIGGADAIADQLFAQKRCKSCVLTTAPVKGAKVLRADNYNTWEERRQALEKLLTQ